MIKVFDYSDPQKGWVEKESYGAAKNFVEKTLHNYWLEDRDNCHTYYLEIYSDGEYEVWSAYCGSWVFEDEPTFDIMFGSRKTYELELEFTKYNPLKDYIII